MDQPAPQPQAEQPKVQTMVVPILGESKAEVLSYIKMLFIGMAGIGIFLFSELIFIILERLKVKWATPKPPEEQEVKAEGDSWR